MTTNNHYFKSLLILVMLTSLFACKDEEGGESSSLNASAGLDQNALVGQSVTLNGNGSYDSEGVPFEYSWEFISKPSSSDVKFDDPSLATPEFTPDVSGKYKIRLTVSHTSESSDTVTVAAFQVGNINGTYDNYSPGPNVGIREFVTACGYLFATCEFTEIGGVAANKIAYYDGEWHSMGCGLEVGSIYAMTEYEGELYVTGHFDEIGCIDANNIARWNCTTKEWSEVEGGITGDEDPFGDALLVYSGDLYVGGRFSQAGNVSANNLAKWDGEEWSAVGNFSDGSVRELAEYKGDLYAGGFFEAVDGANTGSVAVYNGSNWVGIGSVEDLENKATGAVKHMAVFDNELYLAGEFSDDVSELIVWNGSQLYDFGRAFSLGQNRISELAVFNDVLYIGGEFSNVVGSFANNIIQWDGDNWGIMGDGVEGTVLSIEMFEGEIYIGGDFNEAGGQNAENISVWSKD